MRWESLAITVYGQAFRMKHRAMLDVFLKLYLFSPHKGITYRCKMMQVGFLQDDFHAFPLQIMYIDLHPPCLRCSFHLLHLFFVFSLIYVCVDGNLGSNHKE